MISFNLFLRIKIFVVHVGPVCSVVYVYSCYSFHIFINKTVFRNLNDIYISYKRKSKSYFYFIHISKKKIHRYLLGQNESLKKNSDMISDSHCSLRICSAQTGFGYFAAQSLVPIFQKSARPADSLTW